eukprot:s2772_g4.t1
MLPSWGELTSRETQVAVTEAKGGEEILQISDAERSKVFKDAQFPVAQQEIAQGDRLLPDAAEVEIHRAKDLVASYNHVLEDCERNLVWAKRSNQWASWVNIVLGLTVFTVLFYLWVLRPKIQSFSLADKRVLSDTDLVVSDCIRKRPLRPSDFAGK